VLLLAVRSDVIGLIEIRQPSVRYGPLLLRCSKALNAPPRHAGNE
jgi:hypothetical protein